MFLGFSTLLIDDVLLGRDQLGQTWPESNVRRNLCLSTLFKKLAAIAESWLAPDKRIFDVSLVLITVKSFIPGLASRVDLQNLS